MRSNGSPKDAAATIETNTRTGRVDQRTATHRLIWFVIILAAARTIVLLPQLTITSKSETKEVKRQKKALIPEVPPSPQFNSSKPCNNTDDMNDGAWNGHDWVPKQCSLRTFEPTEIKQCLKDKKIAFCGDSLLRNLAGMLAKRLDPSLKFEKSWGDQLFPSIGLNTYWTPSVFHQQCSPNRGSIIIVSETVWNMGTYFRGVDEYEKSLRNVLNVNLKGTERVIWFKLHKLHRERPECRKSPKCYEANSPEKEEKFREIGVRVARESGAEIFDTYGVTNTNFSALDGPDAVHYFNTTTGVELDILLNMIC